MAIVTVGENNGSTRRTPTLSQFAKEGRPVAPRSSIKIIFRPAQYPVWGFITEHGYRVSVYEDNPLYGLIFDSIDTWSSEDVALFCIPTDPVKGRWDLGIETNENSDWQPTDWGFKLQIQEKKSSPSKDGSSRKKRKTSETTGLKVDGEKVLDPSESPSQQLEIEF